jgi:hypothetical protein
VRAKRRLTRKETASRYPQPIPIVGDAVRLPMIICKADLGKMLGPQAALAGGFPVAVLHSRGASIVARAMPNIFPSWTEAGRRQRDGRRC